MSIPPLANQTLISIKTMIDNSLTNLWSRGALQGTKPDDAFTVEVGLGSTMTSKDILNGFMKVAVKLAILRPAEFIIRQLE